MVRKHVHVGSTLALSTAWALAAPWPATAQPADPSGLVTQERLLDGEKAGATGSTTTATTRRTASRRSTQINRDNVKNLKVAWTMASGRRRGGWIWSHGGLEGTPIAEDGFLYVTDGWGAVYKIDARRRGSCCWKMDPQDRQGLGRRRGLLRREQSRRGAVGRQGHLAHAGRTADRHRQGRPARSPGSARWPIPTRAR